MDIKQLLKLIFIKMMNINNWEKVFWESLKESDEYLNLIVNKVIPI